ncbi:MAG: M23 family metallopeptidase [Bacteroidales bacterium]|nr:M23 family metallopeptidase [Bacteroidales bacterium]
MARYSYDRGRFDFEQRRPGFWGYVGIFFKYLALSVMLAIVYYVIFALVVQRDSDRKIARENRMYEKLYPEMQEREALVSDVIEALQARDNRIYKEIFNAEAPAMDPMRNLEYFASSDTLPDADYVHYAGAKATRLEEKAARVEANLRRVMEVCTSSADSLPPLSLPLQNVSYAQVAAGIGDKMHPFYKVSMPHSGLDLIAPQGDPVIAAGDGTVTNIILSRKGLGNVVEITHKGGYMTRYCHLSDIEVHKGQRVRCGQKIAQVGISGTLFAPHLHYEVLRRTVTLDPVNYFFASVTPDVYTNMLYLSSNTGQSLD